MNFLEQAVTVFRGTESALVLVIFLQEDLFDCYVGRLVLVKVSITDAKCSMRYFKIV